MGDTQIQYSFLLEGHEQRHAYKQLGFRVVPVPEAREVTRHWSALGKCISAGNTMGSRIIENDGIYLMRDIARLKSSCNFSAAAADRSSNTLLLTVINPLTDHNVTADGVLLRQIHHNFALQEVCRNNFQRQQVWKSLSFLLCFARLLPRGSLASNQRCHYPGRGLLMRDTSLRSWWGEKKHAQHFWKLLMFYPIIHRPRTWEYVFVGKPWLDTVEPASLVPVSLGWHVWKLLPQSINKVQVLKYLSRQSFILAVDCLSTLPAP